MVVLFKDLAKPAECILKDDYDFSRKLKVKSKTSDGVTFTTEAELTANRSILAKFCASLAHPKSGLVFKKLQINTQGRLVTEAEVNNFGCYGLKLTVKTEDGSSIKDSSAKRSGIVGYEYIQRNYALDGQMDLSKQVLSQSGVIEKDNYRLGAQLGYKIDSNEVTEQNVALSYTQLEYGATIATKKKFSAITAALHHRASLNTIYSAAFDYDLKSGANRLTIGGRYLADPWTEYAGKMESDGNVSLALIQKMSPHVALTTSACVDVKNFDGNGHKFGIGLTLG